MHAPTSDDDWGKPGRIASWEASDSLSAWDREALRRPRRRLPLRHARARRRLAADERRHPHRRPAHPSPPRPAPRDDHPPAHRGGRSRPGARQPAGERDAHLSALRVRPRRAQRRGDDHVARRLPITGVAAGGSMRLLGHDEILDTVAEVYDRVARRPGVLARPTWMWQRYLEKAIELGGDAEFVAVHTSADGVDDGFVHYQREVGRARSTPPAAPARSTTSGAPRRRSSWPCGTTSATSTSSTSGTPRNDPSTTSSSSPSPTRGPTGTKWIFDEQWLRILDVDAALTADATPTSTAP